MLNRPFDGPIPGESLTREPKKFAWERPPEFVDPEDALMFYIDKIMEPKVMRRMMDALELGMSIKGLTEGLLRVGVSEGLHTIDVSLLVAPAIHEANKGMANDFGVEYDEGFEDPERDAEEERMVKSLKIKARNKKMMKEERGKQKRKLFLGEQDDSFTEEFLEEIDEEQEAPMQKPRGLMAKEDF